MIMLAFRSLCGMWRLDLALRQTVVSDGLGHTRIGGCSSKVSVLLALLLLVRFQILFLILFQIVFPVVVILNGCGYFGTTVQLGG